MITMTPGTSRAYTQICVLLACLVSLPAFAAAQEPEVNVVKSVRAVNSTIEIELESSKEFPVRNEVVVLRIGNKEFMKSKTPKGGSLKKLIFILTADEFDQLADGDPMIVTYGRQTDDDITGLSGRRHHEPRWDFGKLNKALLGR